MRRKEREITDKTALEAVIRDTFHVTMAMPTSGVPYMLPMNFGYENGIVYLHCARAGKKLDILRAADGRLPVSLLFVSKASLLDKGKGIICGLSARYASVVATGMLEEVTDNDERLRGLRSVVRQVGVEDRPFTDGDLAAVIVLRVTISDMIGKMNDPA